MSENKILDKIKKLLALASSPNEAEAKLAMNKAQSLMAEYCIQESKLYPNQDFGPQVILTEIYNPPFPASRGLQKALPYIVNALSPMFGCHILVQMNKPLVYGFKTNIEVLKFGLDAILNQARTDYKIGYAKARTITFDESFWAAFSSELKKRFRQNVEQSYGITIYDKVKAKTKEDSKELYNSQSGTDALTGTSAGISSGQNVNLVSGIQSGNQGNLLK